MWKVILAVASHRLILLAVALITINFHSTQNNEGQTIRKILPFSVLFNAFLDKVSQNPEANALNGFRSQPIGEVFKSSTNPFHWVSRLTVAVLPISSSLCVIFWSNVFFLLFLWELFALVERLAIPEVGTGAAIMMGFWVTSYELSLGSSLSLSCFLLMMVLRHAIDNQWLLTGLALGLLALTEPLAVGLLPILLFIFWYFQRHFQALEVLRAFLFFIVPIAVAYFWKGYTPGYFRSLVDSSALFNIIQMFESSGHWSWALSQTFLGQSIAVAIFLIGAVSSLILNTSILYRIIPIFVLTLVLASTPYGTVASRLSLAAVCLGGISGMSSVLLIRLFQAIFIGLGACEIVMLFS